MQNQEIFNIFGTPLLDSEIAQKITGIKYNYFILGGITVGAIILIIYYSHNQQSTDLQIQPNSKVDKPHTNKNN